jgi:hypothetical protein
MYPCLALALASVAVAVGQSFAAIARGSEALVAFSAFVACSARLANQLAGSSPSLKFPAFGVGQHGALSTVGHGTLEVDSESVESSSVSMGDDEEAGSAVRCAHVGRAEIEPLRIAPECGKVGEDAIETTGAEPGDVLDDDPLGIELGDDASELGPQPPRVICPAAGSCDADGLAGEPPAEDVDRFDFPTLHLLNRPEEPGAREPGAQQALAERIHLSLERDARAGPEPASEPVLQTRDAGEERADDEVAHARRFRFFFGNVSSNRWCCGPTVR